jgi:hypothetical protein
VQAAIAVVMALVAILKKKMCVHGAVVVVMALVAILKKNCVCAGSCCGCDGFGGYSHARGVSKPLI